MPNPETLSQIKEKMREIAARIDVLDAQIHEDMKWEDEDLETMMLEVFDQIGDSLDNLFKRLG